MRPKEWTEEKGERHNSSVYGDELAAQVAVLLEDKLTAKGMAIAEVQGIALHVMDKLQNIYGGMMIYFKKGRLVAMNERNKAIYEAYKKGAMTVKEIALQHGFSLQNAYKIIRDCRKQSQEQLESERKEARNNFQRNK